MLTRRAGPLLTPLLAIAAPVGAPPCQKYPDTPRSFGGVYPHLASFNDQNECGTGAVVPWAGRLWWLTYAPHRPDGSDDKLYSTDGSLALTVHPESIGGTPANRLIHEESQQLFIGPYAIDRKGNVRAIPYAQMRGRPTGTARHLFDPAGKVYTATMEEGLYEIDVETLAVTRLFADNHDEGARPVMGLPGYHGKGLYSGQGVLLYSNNGEKSRAAQTRPDIPSGALGQWNGDPGGAWGLVLRNQFTEITGPGGIRGNHDPKRDPIWALGWDHRSVILMLRSAVDGGSWHRFRLPKASHSYDGAHGWNTEWPRIRDVGEDDLLMTMHGTFWRFPRGFDVETLGGIRPRSSYLRVIGDFCRWRDRIVLGCDDAARSEFLNTRRLKGEIAAPAQSQSNLWFVHPQELDRLGPVSGRGALWMHEPIPADTWSDPMLIAGYPRGFVFLVNHSEHPVTFRLQVCDGAGNWRAMERDGVAVSETVRGGGFGEIPLGSATDGEWIRVALDRAAAGTVWFDMHGERRAVERTRFASVARSDDLAPSRPAIGGLLRAGRREQGLQLLATSVDGQVSDPVGYYELTPDLELQPRGEGPERSAEWMAANMAITTDQVSIDGDSVLVVDEGGGRWRLPLGNRNYVDNPGWLPLQRTAREVVTERDLVHVGGTFFELPARNAGGMMRMRAIATHDGFIQDFCSWRGLLALTGIVQNGGSDPRVVRSEDGRAAVWLGAIDDLWHLGAPRGTGSPWLGTAVRKGDVSDPLLVAGYDQRIATFVVDRDVAITIEVDLAGTGRWIEHSTHAIRGGRTDSAFGRPFPIPPASWVRFRANGDAHVTATVELRPAERR